MGRSTANQNPFNNPLASTPPEEHQREPGEGDEMKGIWLGDDDGTIEDDVVQIATVVIPVEKDEGEFNLLSTDDGGEVPVGDPWVACVAQAQGIANFDEGAVIYAGMRSRRLMVPPPPFRDARKSISSKVMANPGSAVMVKPMYSLSERFSAEV